MLTSLLFIFKCIMSAKSSLTFQQSPDPTPGVVSRVPALISAGVGPSSCSHLAVELDVNGDVLLFQLMQSFYFGK